MSALNMCPCTKGTSAFPLTAIHLILLLIFVAVALTTELCGVPSTLCITSETGVP